MNDCMQVRRLVRQRILSPDSGRTGAQRHQKFWEQAPQIFSRLAGWPSGAITPPRDDFVDVQRDAEELGFDLDEAI